MIKTDKNQDYLSKNLFYFSKSDADGWTVDDAFKGTSIMGATGSGKTTASGMAIAKAYLKEGWGGIVLCAKTEEAKLWEQYCKETGRTDDLIIFKKGAKHKSGHKYEGQEIVFNPIDYEMTRKGDGAGETQNIVNMFMNLYRMGNKISGEGDVKEERFWDTALKRCLNRAIELLKLAGMDLSYSNVAQLISSANSHVGVDYGDISYQAEQDKAGTKFEKKFCLMCLIIAYGNTYLVENVDPEMENSFKLVDEYFNKMLPSLADKTKSTILESVLGIAEPFLTGLLRQHFSGKTNIFPEETYEQNKIIVLDFPIKEHLEAGITAQSVFKLLFQQTIERRDVSKHATPVFLWGDEIHYFINPYDQLFLTTARSARAATVFLSQNISNYLAVMGGADSKARVDSLMGNLCTKIFHANTDAVTNQYASELFGNDIGYTPNMNEQQAAFKLHHSESFGLTGGFHPQIQPKKFTTLLTGGAKNNYEVEGIIMASGKKWSDGKNYIEVRFKQNFK